MESIFIAERQFKDKKLMQSICYGNTPVLGIVLLAFVKNNIINS